MVRHARPCLRFSRIIKQQYLWKVLSYFVYLLHAVTHPWKLQCYYVVLVGYGLACPKFSETTNHQHPWKELRDFVDFSQVVVWVLLNIHGSYKSMLFWTGIVRHSLSANQIVRCFKLKKNRTRYEVSKLIFCFHWSQKKYAILRYDRKILLANPFVGPFSFDLFSLLNLIPGSLVTLYWFLFKWNWGLTKLPNSSTYWNLYETYVFDVVFYTIVT